MKLHLLDVWERVRSTLWFAPSLMLLIGAALAVVLVRIEPYVPAPEDLTLGILYVGSPEGARGVLGVIAGSMATAASLAFSITVVALTLASQQFGPRLLRNFMRDLITQAVLGTLIGTFTYALLVLRTIHGNDGAVVPHLAVTAGIALAVISLGVLIYFIHHVASSIQAANVTAAVATELIGTIDRLYPASRDGQKEPAPKDELPPGFFEQAAPVPSTDFGYVQLIDYDHLLSAATHADVILALQRRPGHFVVEGSPLALVWPAGRLSGEIADTVRKSVQLGREGTPTQDVEHGVEQLVQIGVRALSPGINDPFTAINCVDHLGAALARLVRRAPPASYCRDESGRVRVAIWTVSFSDVVESAFHQIRQFSRNIPSVRIRLLETIQHLGHVVRDAEHRAVLLHHASMIAETELISEEHDRRAIREAFEAAAHALAEGTHSPELTPHVSG